MRVDTSTNLTTSEGLKPKDITVDLRGAEAQRQPCHSFSCTCVWAQRLGPSVFKALGSHGEGERTETDDISKAGRATPKADPSRRSNMPSTLPRARHAPAVKLTEVGSKVVVKA